MHRKILLTVTLGTVLSLGSIAQAQVSSTSRQAQAPSTDRQAQAPNTGRRAQAPSTSRRTQAPSTSRRTQAPGTNLEAQAPNADRGARAPNANPGIPQTQQQPDGGISTGAGPGAPNSADRLVSGSEPVTRRGAPAAGGSNAGVGGDPSSSPLLPNGAIRPGNSGGGGEGGSSR